MYENLLKNILKKLEPTLENLKENPENLRESSLLLREVAHDVLLIINLIIYKEGEEEARQKFQELLSVRGFIAHQIFIIYLGKEVSADIFNGNLIFFQQLVLQLGKLITDNSYDNAEFHNQKIEKGELALTEKMFLEKCWYALERLRLSPVTLKNINDFLEGVYVISEMIKNEKYRNIVNFKRFEMLVDNIRNLRNLRNLRNFVEHYIFQDYSSEIENFSQKEEYQIFVIQKINDKYKIPVDQIRELQIEVAGHLNDCCDRESNQNVATRDFVPNTLKELEDKIRELKEVNGQLKSVIAEPICVVLYECKDVSLLADSIKKNGILLDEMVKKNSVKNSLTPSPLNCDITYFQTEIVKKEISKLDEVIRKSQEVKIKNFNFSIAAGILLNGPAGIAIGSSDDRINIYHEIDDKTLKEIEAFIVETVSFDKDQSRKFIEKVISCYIIFVRNENDQSKINSKKNKLEKILFTFFDLKFLYRDTKSVYQEDQQRLMCLLRNINELDFLKKALTTGTLDPNAIFSLEKIPEISLVDYMLSYLYPMPWVIAVIKSQGFNPNHLSDGAPIAFALNMSFEVKYLKNTSIGEPDNYYKPDEVISFLEAMTQCPGFNFDAKRKGYPILFDLCTVIAKNLVPLEKFAENWQVGHLEKMLDFFLKQARPIDFSLVDGAGFSFYAFAFHEQKFSLMKRILFAYQKKCGEAAINDYPDIEEIKRLRDVLSEKFSISFSNRYKDPNSGKITHQDEDENMGVINDLLRHIRKQLPKSSKLKKSSAQIVIKSIFSQQYNLLEFLSRSIEEGLYFFFADYFKSLGLSKELYETHELLMLKVTPEQKKFGKETLERLETIKKLLDTALEKAEKNQSIASVSNGPALFAEKPIPTSMSNEPPRIQGPNGP